MIQTIQQTAQDMQPWKLALYAGLVLAAVLYCWLGKLAEDRRIARIALVQARPMLAYAMDELDRLHATVQDHDRALEALTADPDQEAIDAAIAETDNEADEAEAYMQHAQVVGRKVIA